MGANHFVRTANKYKATLIDEICNMNVTLSVVITTHHRPEYLKRSISSVLQQVGAFEILVCADENSFETRAVCKSLLRECDSFITTLGKGPASSRNLGVARATGDWIIFLDDDDSMERDFFQKLFPYLTAHEVGLYTNYERVYENLECNGKFSTNSIVPYDLDEKDVGDLDVANFIPIHAILFPRRSIANVFFDVSLSSHEDWDFILQVKRRIKLEHIRVFGPRYHFNELQSRNSLNFQKLTKISQGIYRRHKSDSFYITWRRRKRLMRLWLMNLREQIKKIYVG